MFDIRKNFRLALIVFLILVATLFFAVQQVNSKASDPKQAQARFVLLQKMPIASPALITGGRNIAFETNNAFANAPASYLFLLDCCESDEAISGRIAVGLMRCKIIKGN